MEDVQLGGRVGTLKMSYLESTTPDAERIQIINVNHTYQ